MTILLNVHVELFIRIGYKKSETDKHDKGYIEYIMMFSSLRYLNYHNILSNYKFTQAIVISKYVSI